MNGSMAQQHFVLVVILFGFTLICAGEFQPKTTFVDVVPANLSTTYPQRLVKVTWCLFPNVPVKNTIRYFYVKVRKHIAIYGGGGETKYFKVEEHTTCVNDSVRSPKGYEEMRDKYVHEVDKEYYYKNRNIARQIYPGAKLYLSCFSGPHVYLKWLGKDYKDPWYTMKKCAGVLKSCTAREKKTITISREMINNDGIQNIKVTEDISCFYNYNL